MAAALIRTSTGVSSPALVRERRTDQPTPWLGLLLWALACAGLFVSLLMQSEDLKREPRLAADDAARAQIRIAPGACDLPGPLDIAGRLATGIGCRIEQTMPPHDHRYA